MNKLLFILLISLPYLSFSQSFKIIDNDTVNRIDVVGLKQGKWIFFYPNSEIVLKKGTFVDGTKQGVWVEYYQTNIIKNEITYTNDEIDGFAKTYYIDGTLKEQGIWKTDKWVGEYKYFYENGNPQYLWNYSTSGQRTGNQKYFHDNGNIMIEGNWQEGKETGVIKEFSETGKIVAEKSFNDGVFDESTSKNYEKIEESNESNSNLIANADTLKTIKNPVSNNQMIQNGYHKIYNSRKQIEIDGTFSGGFLSDGKRFYYNSEGKLYKTVEFSETRIVKVTYEKK